MQGLVFDIETTGFVGERDPTIHCIATYNLVTKEEILYEPEAVYEGLKSLHFSELIIGHNIAGFDIPYIQQLYPRWRTTGNIWDTLVLSRMLWPERPKHSLDSYGKEFKRLKPEHEDWAKYSKEMGYRCQEDVGINKLLFDKLLKRMGSHDWGAAHDLECGVARIHTFQKISGVDIDVPHAKATVARLDEELELISSSLINLIPMKCKQVGATVRKPYKKDGTITKRVEGWFNV